MSTYGPDNWQIFWATMLVVAAGILVGAPFGAMIDRYKFHEEAIAHSCAHYDPQTGDFRWNEEVTK